MMSLMNILKRITQTEMLFCVHRNIHSVKREYQYFIYVHVIIEIIITLILQFSSLAVTILFKDGLDIDGKARAIMHFFLITSTTIFIIISSIINSKYSVLLINYVGDIESNYVHMDELEPFRRKIHYVSVYYFMSCFLIVVFKLRPMMLRDDLSEVTYSLRVIVTLLNVYAELRFFIENVAYASSIIPVTAYLHCIASSITDMQKYLNYVLDLRQDINNQSLERFYTTYKKRVKMWFLLYGFVDKINYVSRKVYGPHLFLKLCYAQLSVGLMLYQFATTYFVHTYLEIIEWPMVVLIVDSIGLLILLSEGQRVKEGVLTLRRYIARIHHTLLKIDNVPDDILKPTAHLYRSMSTDPVSVVVSLSVQIGMSLLPHLIGFATEYVIIALQANSVI